MVFLSFVALPGGPVQWRRCAVLCSAMPPTCLHQRTASGNTSSPRPARPALALRSGSTDPISDDLLLTAIGSRLASMDDHPQDHTSVGSRGHSTRSATTASTLDVHVDIEKYLIPFSELRFLKQVGAGSFGRVYMAKWQETLVRGAGVWSVDMYAACTYYVCVEGGREGAVVKEAIVTPHLASLWFYQWKSSGVISCVVWGRGGHRSGVQD